jgi:hypothetical protein
MRNHARKGKDIKEKLGGMKPFPPDPPAFYGTNLLPQPDSNK